MAKRRRIVIRRTTSKKQNVIALPPPLVYYCIWCYTEKNCAKDRCLMCGHFGSTTTPQRAISQVYLSSEAV